jgi:integrase
VFRYTFGGAKKAIGLGSASYVTLAAARAEAKKLRDIIATGRDPLAERRKAEAEAGARKTFDDVARFVIKRDRANWTDAHAEAWDKSLLVDAKKLGPLIVGEITVDEVKRAVMPIFDRGHHVVARRTLSRVAAVLECAIAHGWRATANSADWRTFRHIAPKRPKSNGDGRHPAVPWAEASAVMAKLRAIDTTGARVVEFVFLTATRISEACGAQWSEIDFDKAQWTIPSGRMKTRDGPHVVPLSKQALDLLRDLFKHRTGDCVFPGQVDGQPIRRMQAWRVTVAVTDGKASPHGARSTFRSWCAAHGIDRELAEISLAHAVGGVEGRYQRDRMIERRRPIMQSYTDYLEGKGRGGSRLCENSV